MVPALGATLSAAILAACELDFADPSREYGPPVMGEPTHVVIIEAPRTLGVVDSFILDVNGTPLGVGCDTCHGPSAEGSWAAEPGPSFHTKVGLVDPETDVRVLDRHGELECGACHADDRLRLHLASGQVVAFIDGIMLCAQCHGPQHRDYVHGSHGGMTGYWDLRQGHRVRNNCVACHAPHAPHFGRRMPAQAPQDRYLQTDHSLTEHGSLGQGCPRIGGGPWEVT